MGRRTVRIKTGHCCGASCADLIVGHLYVAKEQDRGEFYTKWQRSNWGSLEERMNEWKSWIAAIKALLKRKVEDGTITQKEADRAFQEWLNEHPNPETGEVEQIGIDVTEEYTKNRERVRSTEEAIREKQKV